MAGGDGGAVNPIGGRHSDDLQEALFYRSFWQFGWGGWQRRFWHFRHQGDGGNRSKLSMNAPQVAMKRIVLGIALSLFAVAGVAYGKPADKKEPAAAAEAQKTVTLSGQIGCAHCAIKVGDECADAIRVKEAGKDDTAMCESVRDGKVMGIVGEKDGKKTIKVSKIQFGK